KSRPDRGQDWTPKEVHPLGWTGGGLTIGRGQAATSPVSSLSRPRWLASGWSAQGDRAAGRQGRLPVRSANGAFAEYYLGPFRAEREAVRHGQLISISSKPADLADERG